MDELIYSGKWLEIRKLEVSGGVVWEYVKRTNSSQRSDGVEVVAFLDKKFLVAVAVYRYPVDAFVLEFPAGLMDSEDSEPLETALRELKEETGYSARPQDLVFEGPMIYTDSWKSTESTKYIVLNLDSAQNPNPAQSLDSEEIIKVELIPLKNLASELQDLAQRQNYLIDSRLFTFAEGYGLINTQG